MAEQPNDEDGYFMDFESMFRHPGWSKLQKEIDSRLAGLSDSVFWNAKTFEEIIAARIEIRNLEQLRDYESVIEQRKEARRESRAQSIADALAEIAAAAPEVI
jgi:hypothetical protein